MTYHILNGDCLAQQFSETTLDGAIIICRECLIEGPVEVDSLESFWTHRATFIQTTYGDRPEHYLDTVVNEFKKMASIPGGAEVCLWFEHDLFCQVNMWFVMALYQAYQIEANLYVVYPVMQPGEDVWRGFGHSDGAALQQAYAERLPLSKDDLELGVALWNAYAAKDTQSLVQLSEQSSPVFRYLKEVCSALVDTLQAPDGLSRPERIIKELITLTQGDFDAVFAAFSSREGIYGYSDLYVRSIFNRLMYS